MDIIYARPTPTLSAVEKTSVLSQSGILRHHILRHGVALRSKRHCQITFSHDKQSDIWEFRGYQNSLFIENGRKQTNLKHLNVDENENQISCMNS